MYHTIWENVIMYLLPTKQTVLTPKLPNPGNLKNTLIFGLHSRHLWFIMNQISDIERDCSFTVCLHRVTVVGNLTQLFSIWFLIHYTRFHLRVNSWYLYLLSLSLESLWGSAHTQKKASISVILGNAVSSTLIYISLRYKLLSLLQKLLKFSCLLVFYPYSYS